METTILNGQSFKNLFINGHQSLANDVERINELNVFPVPDGDTGTNMKMTMDGGCNAIRNLSEENIGLVAKEMSRGLVFSARGNSGVILSQFFKGFYLGIAEKEIVNVEEFANAMLSGVKQAYNVVNNPTEGTILTVMREASQNAYDAHAKTFEEYFKVYLIEAKRSLNKTPELLPVLKKAGVIDSGGAGFLLIVEGMALAIDGQMLENVNKQISTAPTVNPNSFNADSELEFGYCTEFILQLQNKKVNIKEFELSTITNYLETIGNSIVAFKDEDIIKVHVHTFVPGKVINYCQQFGEYVTFKMENMSVQHSESSISHEEPKEEAEFKETTIVAVSSGDGISELFMEMGVDRIVSGGQTMNPSTDDFIEIFESLNTKNIIVFPNNSNIIMAAKQAAEFYEKANVCVIETKTLAQCYSALSLITDDDDFENMIYTINMSLSNVLTLEVTYSIRDTQIDDIVIHKDDNLGFIDHKLKVVCENKLDTVKQLFSNIEDISDREVVTIFYGNDTTEEEANEIVDYIESKYGWMEVGAIPGGQNVYSFIIAVE